MRAGGQWHGAAAAAHIAQLLRGRGFWRWAKEELTAAIASSAVGAGTRWFKSRGGKVLHHRKVRRRNA